MNRNDIAQLVPHKDDMLILDEIISVHEKEAIGKYKIKGTEFFLNGHYPNNPIVPGSILCEIMAQLIAVFAAKRRPGLPLLTEITDAKFKKSILPGNELFIKMLVIKDSPRIIVANCSISVNNYIAAQAKLTVAIL